MKIYVSHSTAFDYQTELYLPIREFSKTSLHEFYLPHEKSPEPQNTKSILQHSDLILAEVSYPSTGQGIELGWANLFEIPIIGLHKQSKLASSSLRLILRELYQYDINLSEIMSKLIP